MKRSSYVAFFLIALCYSGGLILHFSYRLFIWGFVLMGVGLVIAYMQKVRALDCAVERASSQDKGWELVSEDNFRALLEKAHKIEGINGNTKRKKSILIILSFIFISVIINLFSKNGEDARLFFEESKGAVYLILLVDIILMIIPLFLFFSFEVKTPSHILTKLKAFLDFSETLGMGFAWRYEVKFEEHKSLGMDNYVKSLRTPTDVRVNLDYVDKDKDWVSLSFICNVNVVKEVEYAFIYAVMVGKRGSRVCEKFLNYSWRGGWYSRDESKGEYNVSVILPEKGYHTSPDKVRSLITQVVNVVSKL